MSFGSSERPVGKIGGVEVILTCMDPEARDLMDEALEQFRAHDAAAKRDFGHLHWWDEDRTYSFAYWLFRYSGLIITRPEE